MAIKIRVNFEKYKRWALEWALATGGKVMFTKIWQWITASAYAELMEQIDDLKKYEDDITKLIQDIPAEKIAGIMITFIQSKLRKIVNKIFGRSV